MTPDDKIPRPAKRVRCNHQSGGEKADMFLPVTRTHDKFLAALFA
jgi:hypothetical protein